MNEDGQNLNNLSNSQPLQTTTVIPGEQSIAEQSALNSISKKKSNRRQFLLFLLIGILLLIISGSFYYVFHYKYFTNIPKQKQLKISANPQNQTSSANHFTEADQQRLETGLVSQDLTVLRSVLADEIASQVKTNILPPGSKVNINLHSFNAYSPLLATISADVSGQKPGEYTIQLIYEDGEWKVLGTSLRK